MKKIFVGILLLTVVAVLWPLAIVTLLTTLTIGTVVAIGGGSANLALGSLGALKDLTLCNSEPLKV